MNLAFLNLPIFGFVDSISKHASACLNNIPEGLRRGIDETPWYKDAAALADLHKLEVFDINRVDPRWVPFKSIFDGVVFNVLFKYRLGKVLSVLATFYASYLIVVGVYQSAGGGELCGIINFISASFWLAVASFFWPAACVALGSYVGWRAKRELRYNLRNLGKSEIKAAVNAIDRTEEAVRAAD
jgi:hypothetical protein